MMMRRETAVRIVALCLLALAGSVLSGALAGPPPGPPPPPPPEEPPPPPPEVYPCALILLPNSEPWLFLMAKLPPEPDLLRASRSLDDGSFILTYDGKHFKTFINPEYSGIQALLKFDQLQKGAIIGGMKALVKFEIIDRGGCIPPTLAAARSYDDGSFLFWMAHAQVIGFIPPPPELMGARIDLNWFMAVIRIKIADGKIDIRDIAGIIFYPDAKYRSPEDMLKAARSLDDGGILKPILPATD